MSITLKTYQIKSGQHFVLYGKVVYMCVEDLRMDIRKTEKRSVWR